MYVGIAVVAQKIGGSLVLYVCPDNQCGRVALAKTEVQVALCLYVEISHVGTEETNFTVSLVMDKAAVGFPEFCPHQYFMLSLLCLVGSVGHVCGLGIVAVFVCGKEGESHLHPFAETLVHGKSHGVAYAHHACPVLNVTSRSPVLVGVEGGVPSLVIERVVHVAHLEGVYDTCHGHELGGFYQFAFPLGAQRVDGKLACHTVRGECHAHGVVQLVKEFYG